MRKNLWLCLEFFLLISVAAWSQPDNPSIVSVSSVPTGTCAGGLPNQQVISTGVQYSCQGVVAGTGTWGPIVGSGTFNALNGDATSTPTGGATTVVGLDGIPFTNTPSPALGDVVCYDGVQYTPCPPSAGAAQILYVTNTASSISNYYLWDTSPLGSQFTVAASIPATNTKTLIKAFATASGYPDITVIPAGEWQADTYAQISSAANTTTMQIDIYKYPVGGPLPALPLFSFADVPITTANLTHYTVEAVEPAITIAATDRLVVMYSMTHNTGSSLTGTIYGGGSTNYSHVHTPIGTGIGYLPVIYPQAVGALSVSPMANPAAPTVTATCTGTCNAAWAYEVVLIDPLGGSFHTAASPDGSAVNSGTLDVSHYNTIASPCAGTIASSYLVYRTEVEVSPLTFGNITPNPVPCGVATVDNGLPGDGTTAPVTNITGATKSNGPTMTPFIVGPLVHSTGSCTTTGIELAGDGYISWCNGTTWQVVASPPA